MPALLCRYPLQLGKQEQCGWSFLLKETHATTGHGVTSHSEKQQQTYSHSVISRLGWQLTGLVFLSEFCRPCKFMTETKVPMEGATGMGLKITPVIWRCLLCHSSMFGPIASNLGLIANPNSPNGGFNPPPASHPSPQPASTLPPTPYNVPSVILQWFWKSCSKSSV